jgi:hypothetical protein
MNAMYGKNFQNIYLQKRYYGHIFLIPPENYLDFLKDVYSKFKNTKGNKSLYELKRLALREAKRTNLNISKDHNTSKSSNPKRISRDDCVKILKAVYDIVNPLIVKLNHNFKNERRKHYEENDKYLMIIKTFEQQKNNLINFTLRTICKAMKLKFTALQESLSIYIERNEEEVVKHINAYAKIGKMFALAPKNLSIEEVLEILRTYYENLNYFTSNSKKSDDNSKFALILINDIIYENYGLEEEQIFAFINERKLTDNREIDKILKSIQGIIMNNFSILFDL